MFLVLITKNFVNAQELPIGRFVGTSFSLEKNGVSFLTNKDLYYHSANLKIIRISEDIYELTLSVYLQRTPETKTLSDTRVDKYQVIWKDKRAGVLINKKKEHFRELSEFLLFNDTLTIKSRVSRNGVIETHSYKRDK